MLAINPKRTLVPARRKVQRWIDAMATGDRAALDIRPTDQDLGELDRAFPPPTRRRPLELLWAPPLWQLHAGGLTSTGEA